MGTFFKNMNIANVVEPNKVSLSQNSNYTIFSRNDNNLDIITELNISINDLQNPGEISYYFSIIESLSGTINRFECKDSVGNTEDSITDNQFIRYYGDNPSTLKSLHNCLLRNTYLTTYFNITIPPIIDPDGYLVQGTSISIKSKGTNKNYNFTIDKNGGLVLPVILFFDEISQASTSDSISEGYPLTEIHLNIFTGKTSRIGQSSDFSLLDESPNTTLTKSYFGEDVWFDINIIKDMISNPFQSGWFDTGTAKSIQFKATRVRQKENELIVREPFFFSDPVFILNGYRRTLEGGDMESYIYDTGNIATPLTKYPLRTHIKGQKQYFNFILAGSNLTDIIIGIKYRLETSDGIFISEVDGLSQDIGLFHPVNSIELDIDSLLDDYSNAGKVLVYLTKDGNTASYPLEFSILPECINPVNDFIYLNSFGGWDSFNFQQYKDQSFKTESNYHYNTKTPQTGISGEYRSVQFIDIEEEFTLITMPLDKQEYERLQEFVSSKAIYEVSTKRYIIIDGVALTHTYADNVSVYEVKFKYSDNYNAEL